MAHSRLVPRWVLALAPVLAILALAPPARGQARPEDPFSLTVSPARFVVPAGESRVDHVFRVSDTGSTPLHVDVELSEFSQAANGQISFTPPTSASAATWVSADPASFDLSPGEVERVRVSITIPPDPEPGERYVGVLFRVPPRSGEGNVAISGAIGAELLIGVPGQVVKRSTIGPIHAPWFADGGPISIGLTVRNLGNVHRDYFKPNHLILEVNGRRIPFPDFSVLRSSTRLVETSWDDPPLFCICTARVVSDDARGHQLIAEDQIIVFPLRLVLGILLATIGLVLLSRGGVRRRRRKEADRLREVREEAYEQARRDLENSRS